jgi:lipoprotein NlpI
MRAILVAAALLAASGVAAVASGYSEFVSGVALWHDSDDLAIAHLSAALADPTLLPSFRAVALYDRGETYMRQKKYDLALADFTAEVAIAPDFDAYIHRSGIYMIQGKEILALADVSAAVALRPDFPLGYHFRGELYERRKDFKSALADAETVIRLDPDGMDGYEERSVAHRYLGDYSAAIDDADHVIRATDGKAAGAYLEKSAAYEERGDFRSALDALNDGVDHQPKDADLLLSRGVLLWEMKRYADAEQSLIKSLAEQPDDGYAVLWLALARGDGHLQNADFEAFADKLDPKTWPMPLVRYFQGRADMAAVTAGATVDAFSRDGNLCEAHFYAAEIDRLQGHGEGERAVLQDLPASCPAGFIEARVATHILKETAP